MVDGMGGTDSKEYRQFCALACQAFNVLRSCGIRLCHRWSWVTWQLSFLLPDEAFDSSFISSLFFRSHSLLPLCSRSFRQDKDLHSNIWRQPMTTMMATEIDSTTKYELVLHTTCATQLMLHGFFSDWFHNLCSNLCFTLCFTTCALFHPVLHNLCFVSCRASQLVLRKPFFKILNRLQH